jgi:leucine-zipper of insertion element IS481
MNLHANAALSLKGRRELCRDVIERERTLTQAAETAGVIVRCGEKRASGGSSAHCWIHECDTRSHALSKHGRHSRYRDGDRRVPRQYGSRLALRSQLPLARRSSLADDLVCVLFSS